MWKLHTCAGPSAVSMKPSSPQSTWAWAPGRTSKRRWSSGGSGQMRSRASATYSFTRW